MGQWVVLYRQQKICREFESHRLHISAFFSGKEQKGNNVFASVHAGDVNGYDSLLLSAMVVRGKGEAPEITVTKSVRVNLWTREIFCWLYSTTQRYVVT